MHLPGLCGSLLESQAIHVWVPVKQQSMIYLKPGLTVRRCVMFLCCCLFMLLLASSGCTFYFHGQKKITPYVLKKAQHCWHQAATLHGNVFGIYMAIQSHRRNIIMLYQRNYYHFNITHFVTLCTTHKYQ